MDTRPKYETPSEMYPTFFKGHIKVVKFLADLEIISIDLRTKKGETACDIAKRNGHQNVVDFLNSWRISPNRLPHETRHSIYIRTLSSYTLPIAKILSVKNARAWVSMVSYLKIIINEILK